MQGLSRTACPRRVALVPLAIPLFVFSLSAPPSLAAAPPTDPASDDAPVFEEEVQVTATRAERRPEEVAAPVSVVTRTEIEDAAANRPGDLFPALPGIEVEGNGPFLGLPVIRGMAGNRVLVLVDGHRLNNSREAINFGGVQPSLVDVSQVEEIEITRGPASVLYGTDAIGGIVNLITHSPRVPAEGMVFGGGVRPRFGSSGDERSVAADLHAASPSWTLFLDGSLRQADDYESPEGRVPGTRAESNAFHAELERRIADGHSAEIDYQRFRGSDIGVPGSNAVFTGEYPYTDRDALSLHYQGRGPASVGPALRWIEASAYLQEQTESFATVLDLPPVPAGPYRLSIDTETERVGDVETAGIDLLARAAVGESHLVTYGVQWFRDDVTETRREVSTLAFDPLFPGPPPFVETEEDDSPTTPEGSFQGVGVFVQDEILLDRWTILPGVRYDRFDIDTEPLVRDEGVQPAESRSEDAVSASLGALYRVTDSWSLAVSAGRAFRTPNLIERYFFGPGSQGGLTVPNPELDNETSLNFDLGAKLHARNLRGSITAFRNEIDDYITFVPGTLDGQPTVGGQPVTTVDNIGEARVEGIEADAEYAIQSGGHRWRIFGAATYNRAENLSGDEPLFVAPFKVVGGVHWTALRLPVGGHLTARWVDGQDRVPTGFTPTESFTTADLGAVVRLERWVGRDLSLRATVENLADESYTEPYGAVLEPGRSYVVALDLDLRTGTP